MKKLTDLEKSQILADKMAPILKAVEAFSFQDLEILDEFIKHEGDRLSKIKSWIVPQDQKQANTELILNTAMTIRKLYKIRTDGKSKVIEGAVQDAFQTRLADMF